ncbi:MAG: succinate dehydrogenase assembly factor 2 [Micavibrio sp.]|nr:succinate dehydrogenase assembly factor 2 [Micavibrio sp.]|tara:strand:+ start:1866 stop:2129 length:264 start_codon:yes stop_codon:yes gene_type:complete
MKENLEDKRKRLIFRSWHRGTKEMDLVMGTFADKHMPIMEEPNLSLYDDLLSESDPDLYNWVTGREDVPANKLNPVLEMLLAHKFTG